MMAQPIKLDIKYKRVVNSTRRALKRIRRSNPDATVVIHHSVIPLYIPRIGDSPPAYKEWNPQIPSKWMVCIHTRDSKNGDAQDMHKRYFDALYNDIEIIMTAMCTK
jgi:hypothetical protein